ncbi:MAG: type II 3-dehydroquinate dehydratase [Treponema sp.]|jgi:3-dehydroquinate dehydratase-2|nr:type II 3-dehydroquinate dehydratase [Treponema sp.]
MKFLIINGPNLNMLGTREPSIYGKKTYKDLVRFLKTSAKKNNVKIKIIQSNSESCIVSKIQKAYNRFNGIIINPAAYTHTSVAILDALKAVSIPAVEVHLSEVSKRENFRQISYAGMFCFETFAGFGFDGYEMAIKALINKLKH